MATAESGDGGTEARTSQILEFELEEETYCVSIDHVTEIVDMGSVTTVPNAPSHVEGVMDLRGNTTTIISPKALLDLGTDRDAKRIIVFDPTMFEDDQSIGWVVDGVDEVARVTDDDVDESPVEDEHIQGIVKRDDDFVVWLKPRELHT